MSLSRPARNEPPLVSDASLCRFRSGAVRLQSENGAPIRAAAGSHCCAGWNYRDGGGAESFGLSSSHHGQRFARGDTWWKKFKMVGAAPGIRGQNRHLDFGERDTEDTNYSGGGSSIGDRDYRPVSGPRAQSYSAISHSSRAMEAAVRRSFGGSFLNCW